MSEVFRFDWDAPFVPQAQALRKLLREGQIDPEVAEEEFCFMELAADPHDRREAGEVALTRLRIDDAIGKTAFLAEVEGAKSLHLALRDPGAEVMIHKAVRPDAPEGSYQVTRFGRVGNETLPFGHHYKPTIAEAVEEVWTEHRKPIRVIGRTNPSAIRGMEQHLADEEEWIFPLLPTSLAAHLAGEHAKIREGFRTGRIPYALLEHHATFEDEVFPQYVSLDQAESFRRDHDAYRQAVAEGRPIKPNPPTERWEELVTDPDYVYRLIGPGKARDEVGRVLRSGAVPPLEFQGAGGSASVFCDSTNRAFKVAHHLESVELLADEVAWLRAAKAHPKTAHLVPRVFAWLPREVVIVRECVRGETGRWSSPWQEWHEQLNVPGWTRPEGGERQWVQTPTGPVLIDGGHALRRGEVLARHVEALLDAGPVTKAEDGVRVGPYQEKSRDLAWAVYTDWKTGHLSGWRAEPLLARLRAAGDTSEFSDPSKWHRRNPPRAKAAMRRVRKTVGRGQECYPAAEVVYHAGGGRGAGLTPMQQRHEGESHWWVRGPEGEVLDPAAAQFRKPVPYQRGRGRGFLTSRPSRRARELAKRAGVKLRNPDDQRGLFESPLDRAWVEEEYPGRWVMVGTESEEDQAEVARYVTYEASQDELREWASGQVGRDVRRVFPTNPDSFTGEAALGFLYFDYGITLARTDPRTALEHGALSRDQIRGYVEEWHEHYPGTSHVYYFGFAIYNGPPSRDNENLIGVALIGRPAPHTDAQAREGLGPKVANVVKVAIDRELPRQITYEAVGKVYDAAAQEAHRLGFDFLETYTLFSESGQSLRYANWAAPGISRTQSRWRKTGTARARKSGRRGESRASDEPKWRWWKRLSDRWPFPAKPKLGNPDWSDRARARAEEDPEAAHRQAILLKHRMGELDEGSPDLLEAIAARGLDFDRAHEQGTYLPSAAAILHRLVSVYTRELESVADSVSLTIGGAIWRAPIWAGASFVQWGVYNVGRGRARVARARAEALVARFPGKYEVSIGYDTSVVLIADPDRFFAAAEYVHRNYVQIIAELRA